MYTGIHIRRIPLITSSDGNAYCVVFFSCLAIQCGIQLNYILSACLIQFTLHLCKFDRFVSHAYQCIDIVTCLVGRAVSVQGIPTEN